MFAHAATRRVSISILTSKRTCRAPSAVELTEVFLRRGSSQATFICQTQNFILSNTNKRFHNYFRSILRSIWFQIHLSLSINFNASGFKLGQDAPALPWAIQVSVQVQISV
jgi:hypothetical protein